MSTNAVIRVEGLFSLEIYKHWDGYPEATLEWLEDFNKKFTEERGDDPNYKFAQVLRSSAFDCEKYNLDSSRSTGWGVGEKGTFYYDYLYILRKDGSVDVTKNNE